MLSGKLVKHEVIEEQTRLDSIVLSGMGSDRIRYYLHSSVPSDAVKEFVGAVVQAELRGNPVANVLRIQAEVLRHKRVQDAEAYIQTANLQLLAPIMLVIIALMAIIIVPMVMVVGDSLAGSGKAF